MFNMLKKIGNGNKEEVKEEICVYKTENGKEFIGEYIDTVCNMYDYATSKGIVSLKSRAEKIKDANVNDARNVKTIIGNLYKGKKVKFLTMENIR